MSRLSNQRDITFRQSDGYSGLWKLTYRCLNWQFSQLGSFTRSHIQRALCVMFGYRCIGYYFPRYATRTSQYEMMRPTVGDEKLLIDSLQLGKKKYVLNVFYIYGTWILSECFKFYNLCTTLIFYIHNVMMLKIIMHTEKNRYYRWKFSFINDYTRTSLNIILFWNGKVDSLKITNYIKKLFE